MKMAILVPHMNKKRGAQNNAFWLASELNRRGHDVHILTEICDEGLWSQNHENVKIKVILNRFDDKQLSNPKHLHKIGAEIRDILFEYELVNPRNHPSHLWTWAALGEGGRNAPSVIWYCHEPRRRLYGEITDLHISSTVSRLGDDIIDIDKRAVGRADAILCNSQYTASNISKVYGLTAHVCHPGVPIQDPLVKKRRFFRMVSRITPKKNTMEVLKAMKILQTNYADRDIRLQIAGEGPEKKQLAYMIKEMSLRNVELAGFIDDSNLPDFYAGAIAVVYVPLDEPFGLVPLEAGMQKTPVIASNHGGPLETVIDDKTGIIVNPHDPEKIAWAMLKIYDNPKRSRWMGENMHGRVMQNFTIKHYADRFEDLVVKLNLK